MRIKSSHVCKSFSAGYTFYGWSRKPWRLLLWGFRFLWANWSANQPPRWHNTMARGHRLALLGWTICHGDDGRGAKREGELMKPEFLRTGFESRYSFNVLCHPLLIQGNEHRSPASVPLGEHCLRYSATWASPLETEQTMGWKKRGIKQNLAISYPE